MVLSFSQKEEQQDINVVEGKLVHAGHHDNSLHFSQSLLVNHQKSCKSSVALSRISTTGTEEATIELLSSKKSLVTRVA